MLDTKQFGGKLLEAGFQFFSGVPCSFLKDFINYAINEKKYIMAANEGDAVAICAGAYLGGTKSAVLMQNSGLTNATSPLTSLNAIFKIPVLGFVSLRGEEGLHDEPQHELMGKITAGMLDVMRIPWEYLSDNMETALKQIDRANETVERKESFFFIVRKNTFDKVKLGEQEKNIPVKGEILDSGKSDSFPQRMDVLRSLSGKKDKKTIFLASTGFTGREMYEIDDAPNNLYMVGSLGCIGSLALGLAIARKDKDIVAVDGDGSLLMRMGSLATNAYYAPENMLHILLDNNAHESTGGQKTVSYSVDFPSIVKGCGYRKIFAVHSIEEFAVAVLKWKKEKGLSFIYFKIKAGSKEDLARPKIKPFEVKERLIKFLKE